MMLLQSEAVDHVVRLDQSLVAIIGLFQLGVSSFGLYAILSFVHVVNSTIALCFLHKLEPRAEESRGGSLSDSNI